MVEAPLSLEGKAGGKVEFEAIAKLVSDVPGSALGVEGYSIGLSAQGGTILSATVSGTVAARAPEGLVQPTNSFEHTELTSGAGNEGVTSAVVFSLGEGVTLAPTGTATLLRVSVEAPVPQPYVSGGKYVCAPGNCTIAYRDALVGTGEPVENKVSLAGESYRPTLGSAIVEICPTIFEPGFRLSVDAPASVVGEAGGITRFEAKSQLTTTSNPTSEGAQGWSVALAAVDCSIVAATTAGTAGDVIPVGYRRPTNSFESTELTVGTGNEGAVSAVVLSYGEPATLPATGTADVLRLTLEAEVPEPVVSGGDLVCGPRVCRVVYQDGLEGAGEPTENKVGFRGLSYRPSLFAGVTEVCPDVSTENPTFTLSLQAPTSVEGAAGSPVEFEAVAELTTSNNSTTLGVEGWSVALSAEGGEILAATTDGTAGDIIPTGYRTETNSFESTELTLGSGNSGVVSAVVLSYSGSSSLPLAGKVGLLNMRIRSQVPDPIVSGGQLVCQPATCRVFYQNGLVGTGEPVDNKVSFRGLSFRPTRFSGVTDVCPEISDDRPDFALSISAPATADGPGESTVRFDAVAELETTNNPGTERVQGWSLGVTASAGEIVAATTAGTAGDVVPAGYRIAADSFESTELTFGEGNSGAVSAVVLSYQGTSSLPPTGKVEVLKLSVEATARAPSLVDGQPRCNPLECRIFFADGLEGTAEPVDNKVTYLGFAYRPSLGEATTVVCGSSVGGIQKPGDANQDGIFDISDPIYLLGFLFTGEFESLPCGDGEIGDPGNLGLLDVNLDGGIDLSDPIYTLSYLFTGGPEPLMCTTEACPCMPILGCPSNPKGNCAN
jgi:hypothetical protein